MINGELRRNADGSVDMWDVDSHWWPEGLWMRVCATCLRGPLGDHEIACHEHLLGP